MDLAPYHAALLKANTVIVSLLDKKRELLKENRNLEDFIGVNTLKANNGVAKAIQTETSSSCNITASIINQHDSSSDISKIVVALQAANNTISKLKEDIETLNIKCDKLKRTQNNLKNDENEILETIPTKKMKALNANMFDNKNQFDACYNKLNDLYINSS
jgi:predicted RNase H-like nuclease (RuvC/YqgF family)